MSGLKPVAKDEKWGRREHCRVGDHEDQALGKLEQEGAIYNGAFFSREDMPGIMQTVSGAAGKAI